MVTISATNAVTGLRKEYRIPKQTETLAIMSYPGTAIGQVEGLEQLANVKKLLINGFNEIAGMAPQVPKGIYGFVGLEVLDISGCTLKDLGFLNGFSSLRTLILGSTEIADMHSFDFRRFDKLESVWMIGVRLQGQVEVLNGKATPSRSPLPFDATFGPSVKVVYLSSDEYPLPLSKGFFDNASGIPFVYVSKMSYEAGKNGPLDAKYRNVKIVSAKDGSDVRRYLPPGLYYQDVEGDWRTYPTIE